MPNDALNMLGYVGQGFASLKGVSLREAWPWGTALAVGNLFLVPENGALL
jgi:hypothetical protein